MIIRYRVAAKKYIQNAVHRVIIIVVAIIIVIIILVIGLHPYCTYCVPDTILAHDVVTHSHICGPQIILLFLSFSHFQPSSLFLHPSGQDVVLPVTVKMLFKKYDHSPSLNPPQTTTCLPLKPLSGFLWPSGPCVFWPLCDFPAWPEVHSILPRLQPHRPFLVLQESCSGYRRLFIPSVPFLINPGLGLLAQVEKPSLPWGPPSPSS